MPDLDEFDLIARRFAPLSGDGTASLGLTDDAALLKPDPGYEFVVTTDTLVEGVHFPVDEDPGRIARKALRVNLSDVAGMGASPCAVLLNLGLKNGTDAAWVDAFADGLADDLKAFGIPLIGGDTVASPAATTLTITAFGQVREGRALRRSAARPDDLICVTGTLGDAAIGLKVALGEFHSGNAEHDAFLLERYRIPQPRVGVAAALGGLEAGAIGACMDISDGLLQDLGHMTKASGCGAVLERDALPLSDAARFVVEKDSTFLESVLGGGDDYELVFTLRPDHAPRILDDLRKNCGVPVTVIGRIRKDAGISLLDGQGHPLEIGSSRGYRHRF